MVQGLSTPPTNNTKLSAAGVIKQVFILPPIYQQQHMALEEHFPLVDVTKCRQLHLQVQLLGTE
jgi:hypothetical protein